MRGLLIVVLWLAVYRPFCRRRPPRRQNHGRCGLGKLVIALLKEIGH
jgi:hypothetical protein